MGEGGVVGHQGLALLIVVLCDEGEGVEHKCGEFRVSVGLTPLGHLDDGVGGSTLVTEDGASELKQGVLHGGHTAGVPAPHGLDTHLFTNNEK